MYCPKCATQNLDESKFCRVCGINLASVALALSDQLPNIANRDTKAERLSSNARNHRRRALNKFIEGSGMLAGSAIVGAALGIFSHNPDWIIIWVVFGAWLAVFGVLSIGKGIGSLIESKYALDELQDIQTLPEKLHPAEFQNISAPVTSPKLTPISSVTEGTTELLGEGQDRNSSL